MPWQTPAQHSATGAFNMRMEDNATMGMNDAYAGMQGFGGQWMSQQMSKPGQGMVMGTQMINGAGQASGLQMQLRQATTQRCCMRMSIADRNILGSQILEEQIRRIP